MLLTSELLILFMSELHQGLLQLPSSFDFHRDTTDNYRNNSIDPQMFHIWMKRDMYRSSYANHHSPDSVNPRVSFIPGYAGFIPTKKSESLHAKGFTNESKLALSNPRVGRNTYGLASTGLNLTSDALIDNSKLASSSKYGKSELQRPHPGWTPQKWCSTTKDVYRAPASQLDVTYRDTGDHAITSKPHTKTSGFTVDRAYMDGHGWKPHPVLKPLEHSTQYNDRFNPERDFHRRVDQSKERRLKPVERVYRFNR